MILISNNVKDEIELKSDTVIRVNVAWVESIGELQKILDGLTDYQVYLDYPEGRTKPPVPTLAFGTVVAMIGLYKNIKYFAISNAEDPFDMRSKRAIVPSSVKIVPKIESPQGVISVLEIVRAAETDMVMLDKEDLYSAVNKDSLLYNHFVDVLRKTCKSKNIKVLELQGVVFYERKN